VSKNPKIKDATNYAFKFRIYPDKKQLEVIEAGFKLDRVCYNFFVARETENNNLATLEYFKSIFPNDTITFEKIEETNKRKSFLKNGTRIEFDDIDKDELRKFVNDYKKKNDLFFRKKGNKDYGVDGAYQIFNKLYTQETLASKSLIIYTIDAFDSALQKCYKKQGGFPKFKSYRDSNQSFSLQIQTSLNIRQKKTSKRFLIDLPKIKDVEVIIHNDVFFNNNKVKKVTISKNCMDEYHISFMVHNPDMIAEPPKSEIDYDTSIGIDANIGHLNLNGDEILMTKIMQQYNDRLKIVNKKLSKKEGSKKGEVKSKSYEKLRRTSNKIHNKIVNIRNHRNHQIANELLKLDSDTIILEELKVKKMTERTVNQTERSKQNTKEKRSMRRNMLDMGWNDLFIKLETKSKRTPKNVVKIDPAYTSKTCNACGDINKDLKLRDREWICPKCGTKHNRDENASKNIKDKYFERGVYQKVL
jgi:putative transposase